MSKLLRITGRVHIWLGIFTVALFGFTGHYMDGVYNHLVGYDTTTRMLFRSVHIYILFAGIMHFFLGLNYTAAKPAWKQVLQFIGSVLLIIVPFFLAIAFIIEPWLQDLARPYTRPAVYSAFAGGIIYFLVWALPDSLRLSG